MPRAICAYWLSCTALGRGTGFLSPIAHHIRNGCSCARRTLPRASAKAHTLFPRPSFFQVGVRVSLGLARGFSCRSGVELLDLCSVCLCVAHTGRVSSARAAFFCVVLRRCGRWSLRHLRLSALSCVLRHCLRKFALEYTDVLESFEAGRHPELPCLSVLHPTGVLRLQ